MAISAPGRIWQAPTAGYIRGYDWPSFAGPATGPEQIPYPVIGAPACRSVACETRACSRHRLCGIAPCCPPGVRDCTSSVHPVRDYMCLNEDGICSGPRHTEIMKNTRHTSSRRIQRRNEREQRVLAGEPAATLDWRCPLCDVWYSNFRGRNIIHLRSCKKKRADRAALEERRRAQTPPPSPDYFSPRSTPDSVSIPQSPTLSQAGPSTAGGDQQDQYLEDDSPEPPALGEVQADGESDAVF